jgi:geranylgeranyl diphosphate synthase type II
MSGICAGQYLDTDGEGKPLTLDELTNIHLWKTAALLKAACLLGLTASPVFASQEQWQAAERYAEELGMAFQIRDDMLDVIGSAEELGKSVGTDMKKNTYVRLYGLERCEQMVQQNTKIAINALDIFREPGFLRELAMELTSRTK